MAGLNGSIIYGIPARARRVVKFNPIDKSMTHIGPDFGDDEYKWMRGAMTDSGIIYCVPRSHRGILKIDTNTDNVTELDRNLLPELGNEMWLSCAAAPDGCIYCMPTNARRILKIDPKNEDAMSSVGDVLVGGGIANGFHKYIGTVIGIDGCVYGIRKYSNRIVKYDPSNDITSFVGEKANKNFCCGGNGALGRDGCIYALSKYRILKIDTVNNQYGSKDDIGAYGGDAILGVDGCIYWPPEYGNRLWRYDPIFNHSCMVGDDFGNGNGIKWTSGAMASNGLIYCFPCRHNRILAIDPWKEFSVITKRKMDRAPQKLGFIFLDIFDHFDCGVLKFGEKKVHQLLEECLPPANESFSSSGLYPLMIAASLPNVPLSVTYFLIRQHPSFASSVNLFRE